MKYVPRSTFIVILSFETISILITFSRGSCPIYKSYQKRPIKYYRQWPIGNTLKIFLMRKSGRTLSPKAYFITFIPDVEISKFDFPWYELAIWLLSSAQMKKIYFFTRIVYITQKKNWIHTHQFRWTTQKINRLYSNNQNNSNIDI